MILDSMFYYVLIQDKAGDTVTIGMLGASRIGLIKSVKVYRMFSH